jgi:ABC-type multidrug transport system fused ATPase/permease subunit
MAYSAIAGNIPRYFIEGVCFGGIVILALFLLQSNENLGDTVPILAAFGFAGYKIIPAFQQLYFNLTQFRFSGFALRNISTEFEEITICKLTEFQSYPTFNFKKNIELREITHFHQNKKNPVLSKLNLEIKKGEMVGIVGKSGSGKSTLLNLLLCLLEPTQGEMRVDEKTLFDNNRGAFMRSIGYVPQSIYLLDDTIKNNIAFGVPEDEIDIKAVRKAAKKANIDDFIINDLDAGYDSKVGDRGTNLSGGQIQRIGIARSLYHDPCILVLDEATSALDSLTEETIISTIKSLTPAKTVIVVAHQTKTVRQCDNIFLLEDGKFTQQGKFEILIKNSSVFRDLYEV